MFDRARFCERALDLRTRCFEDEASVLVLLSYRVVLSLSLYIYIYLDSIRSDPMVNQSVIDSRSTG